MHLLTNSAPISLNKKLGSLPAGQWLVDDLNAFEIAQKAVRGTVTIKDHGWAPWLSQEEEAPTLIMRSGAIGDLLMLSAVIHAMPKPWPTVCTFPRHAPALQGSGIPLETYPLAFSQISKYGKIISLENVLEQDKEHLGHDVLAKALGVPTPLKSYKPIYIATVEEQEAAKKHLFRGRPNVAIQPRASTANRDYPSELWYSVMIDLVRRGWGILLLGEKHQVPALPPLMQTPFIRNLADENLSLRESVAVLSLCDAFAGVDSSFMHFAAALDIPSVSLHGPFLWQWRTANYLKNTALSGSGACAGCGWHIHENNHFPPFKPCTRPQICVVLANIKPARIVAKIDLLKPCASPSPS